MSEQTQAAEPSPLLTWKDVRVSTYAGYAGGIQMFLYTYDSSKQHPGEPWILTTDLPGYTGQRWRGKDEAALRERAGHILAYWLKKVGGGTEKPADPASQP